MGANAIDMLLKGTSANETQLLIVSGGDDQGVTSNSITLKVLCASAYASFYIFNRERKDRSMLCQLTATFRGTPVGLPSKEWR